MTSPILAWGSGPWGSFSWGGGVGAGAITVLEVIAIRENVIRLHFSAKPYYTGLLDAPDASLVRKYSVTPVVGTVGYNGSAARPVSVARIALVLDDANALDVVLDRPMTPFPANYIVKVDDIFSADLLSAIPATSQSAPAVFAQLSPPTVDTASPSRDMSNPQTGEITDPNAAAILGSFEVDTSGDFSMEEGIQALKNRIYRRMSTRRGAFAHLPEYGIGVKDYGKKLSTAAAISSLVSDTEAQIAQEPEVQFVRVRPIQDRLADGLLRLRIAVRTKTGKAAAFDSPFVTTS